jgi:hypothetical protein
MGTLGLQGGEDVSAKLPAHGRDTPRGGRERYVHRLNCGERGRGRTGRRPLLLQRRNGMEWNAPMLQLWGLGGQTDDQGANVGNCDKRGSRTIEANSEQ